MRADRREADDVAIGSDAVRDALAELEQHARRIIVGIANIKRLVELEIVDVRQPVGWVVHAGGRRRGFGLRNRDSGSRYTGGSHTGAGQEFSSTDVDHHLTSLHGVTPCPSFRSSDFGRRP